MSCHRLSVVSVMALVLGACTGTRQENTPEPVPDIVPIEAPAPAAPSPPAEPDRSAMRLRIAAVGDMMLGTDFPDNRLPDDDGYGFLREVSDALSNADVTFGNVEGVLIDGGTPAKRCKNPRACYLFRSPTRYAQHFADAGFDAVSLANNHARDFGEEGRDASMQAFDTVGIHHSGRVDDFASWREGDLDIALAAFAVTRNSNMMLDIVDAAGTVARLASDHDIVIVSFHGGAEGLDALHVPFAEETYYNEPRGDVVAFARAMVDSGADLVLGHGPHVVRAIERYKNRLIAYSLGNFATYYGISVNGLKGIAPILTVTVDGFGNMIEGKVISTRQIRPGGPVPDPEQRALREIRRLTEADFGDSGLGILPDGSLVPTERRFLRTHDTPWPRQAEAPITQP